MDDATREGGALEAGYGGGVAGEHAGIVGDGCFACEGAPKAGGGLLRQLEAGPLGVTREQRQGDEGRFDGRMHGFSSG